MENNVAEITNGVHTENEVEMSSVFDPIMASLPNVAPKRQERVSDVDVLHSKVLGLEFMKLSLEVELLKQQMAMITVQLAERERTRKGLLVKADTLHAEYLSKYGIDIQAGKINDDGTFSPALGQRPPSGS